MPRKTRSIPHNKLKSETVASILDRMALGGPTQAIAKEVGVATSTVWSLRNDFPLWEWYRQNKSNDSGTEN